MMTNAAIRIWRGLEVGWAGEVVTRVPAKVKVRQREASGLFKWCPRGDSNPHAVRHRLLRPACLPIPPPGQKTEGAWIRFSRGGARVLFRAKKSAASTGKLNQPRRFY